MLFGIQCRLCLKQINNMRNIILHPETTDYKLSIPESIYLFFGIKVDKNDTFSKMVCANCLSVIQLIHIHRRKFRDAQQSLQPIIKEDTENPEQDEDVPPVLEPYYSFKTDKCDANDHENTQHVNIPQCKETKNQESKYIMVPKEFFNKLNCPRITIPLDDIAIANAALYGTSSPFESKTQTKLKSMKKKYLTHKYTEGRRGVIRELIQEKARKNLYVTDLGCDDNRIRSVYEYDINLKPPKEDLWEVNMEMDVFVCKLCNQVFYKEYLLEKHQEVHEPFRVKMQVWKVIF